MPFTPCHVLGVLPLKRKLPYLALAVGSMVPDFGYYIAPNQYFSESAHTWVRSFTFCLPVGSAVVVFILLTKRGWKRVMPTRLADKVDRLPGWNVPLAVWIGALTHIFWDAWTHADGYFVNLFSFFPYKWVQHGSTLLGFAVLTPMFIRSLQPASQWSRLVRIFWPTSLLLSTLIVWFGFRPGDPHALTDKRYYFLLLSSFLGVWILVVSIGVLGIFIADTVYGRKRAMKTPNPIQ